MHYIKSPFKGGLISYFFFQFASNSENRCQITILNILFILMVSVLDSDLHLFWEIWAKVKNFLRSSHLYYCPVTHVWLQLLSRKLLLTFCKIGTIKLEEKGKYRLSNNAGIALIRENMVNLQNVQSIFINLLYLLTAMKLVWMHFL